MPRWSGFLDAAEEDRRSAELLIGPVPRTAAFHAQQAAEKLIKGLLTAEQVEFRNLANRHSIAGLLLVVPRDSEFRSELAKLVHLEAYATAFRYPTPSGTLKPVSDPAALRSALDAIAVLLVDIRAHCETMA